MLTPKPGLQVGFALGRGWEMAEPDWPEAAKWFRFAVEADHLGAMHALGVCHARGRGVEQDWDAAFGHFSTAAELGEVSAMFQTAWCYLNGRGVERNLEDATHWCGQAEEGGHGNAAKMLAQIEEAAKVDRRMQRAAPEDSPEPEPEDAAAESETAVQENTDAPLSPKSKPSRKSKPARKKVVMVDEEPKRALTAEEKKQMRRTLREKDFDPRVWWESLREALPRALAGSAADQAVVGYALGCGWDKANPDWKEVGVSGGADCRAATPTALH